MFKTVSGVNLIKVVENQHLLGMRRAVKGQNSVQTFVLAGKGRSTGLEIDGSVGWKTTGIIFLFSFF